MKAIASRISAFVIVTAWLDVDTANMLNAYAHAHDRRSARERVYESLDEYVRPHKKRERVARERMGLGVGKLWYRRMPLWIRKDKDGVWDGFCMRATYLRGTIVLEDLIRDAMLWRSANGDGETWVQNRHKVTIHHGSNLGTELAEDRAKNNQHYVPSYGGGSANRFIHWRIEDLGKPINRAALSGLALSAELREVASEVERWVRSADWYAERGLSHRRGYLLHGKPGTGKTSLVRGLAEEHNLPVHIMDLATMSNADLHKEWAIAVADSPCVILIEDIDAVFRKRENVAKLGGLMSSGGLTFDALLNRVDGVERTNGVLLVVTTNHIEHVDDALVSRPGRIDRVVEIGPLGHDERLSIARRIVGDEVSAEALASEHVNATASAFVEACTRVALPRILRRGDGETTKVVELKCEVSR